MRDLMVLVGGLADAGSGAGEGGGKTALETARTPALDALATEGILGLTRLVPEGGAATTTATMLAVLGRDPEAVEVAPGVAVAAGLGAAVGDGERVAVLDLVTAGVDDAGREIVSGIGGAYLGRAERSRLGGRLAEVLADYGVAVHPGSQSAVVLGPGGFVERPGPPWTALGQPLGGAETDARLRRAARDAIQESPVVTSRRAGGASVPTDVWVWGGGERVTELAAFGESGIVLADEPAPLGIARLLGLESDVLDAPEDLDGSWDRLVPRIMAALERHLFTLLHLDLVDAVGHRGDAAAKVAAIETIDRELMGPLRQALQAQGGDWRLAVVAGHATSPSTRAHTADPVPFVVYASRPDHRSPHPRRRFHERDAREQGIFIPDGHGLIARLTRR